MFGKQTIFLFIVFFTIFAKILNMDKNNLQKLIDDGLSIRKISKKTGKTNAQVRYLLKKHELKTNGRNRIYDWSKESIINAIKKSECKSDIIRNIGASVRSGNFQTLDRYCNLYSIDISKLKYKGNNFNKFKRVDDSSIFIENSTFTSSALKRRVIKDNILENKCCKCGNNGEWCGEPISLQIDHINVIKNDHRVENLRILCPNCHSQTITYRGRNIRKEKKEKDNKIIISKLKFNITKEELHELVWSKPTTHIAKQFNVSDSAIGKRCKLLGVEKPPRGYWSKK